jgi:hypothetical protein
MSQKNLHAVPKIVMQRSSSLTDARVIKSPRSPKDDTIPVPLKVSQYHLRLAAPTYINKKHELEYSYLTFHQYILLCELSKYEDLLVIAYMNNVKKYLMKYHGVINIAGTNYMVGDLVIVQHYKDSTPRTSADAQLHLSDYVKYYRPRYTFIAILQLNGEILTSVYPILEREQSIAVGKSMSYGEIVGDESPLYLNGNLVLDDSNSYVKMTLFSYAEFLLIDFSKNPNI